MIGDQRLLSSREFVAASPVFRPNRLIVRLQILLYLLISGLLFAVPYDYALAWLGIAAALVLLCVTHRVSLRALLRRLWPVAVPVGMLTLFLALSGPGAKTPQAISTDNARLYGQPAADRSIKATGTGATGALAPLATAPLATASSVERSRMFLAIPLRIVLLAWAAAWLTCVVPVQALLSELHRWGMPAALLQILQQTVRGVAILRQELIRMQTARRARTFDSARWWQVWIGHAQLLGNLVIRSLSRADRVHQAMLARGWNGHARQIDWDEFDAGG